MSALIEKLKSRFMAQYRGSRAESFLNWWRSELADMLPDRAANVLDWQPERLVVVAGDDEWLLYRTNRHEAVEIDRVRVGAEESGTTRERLPRLLAEFEDERPLTVLALPRGRALRKRLSLPAAAEENLRQVLAFEMDRQTPFKADHVHFDFRIVGRDPRTREIGIDLVVAPRDVVDRAAEAAAGRGLALDGVDVLEAEGPPPVLGGVNLLPAAQRVNRPHTTLKLNAALGAAAVILLGLVMWQSLALKSQRIEALEERVAAARDQAMAVAELRGELEEAVKSANFLVRRKESQPVFLDVLREVTDILPDDTWLTRFQLNDNEVQLYGESDSASRLIGLLDESPMLAGANFISPVTTNTSTGNERFNLEAGVLPPDERPEPEPAPESAPESGADAPGGAEAADPSQSTDSEEAGDGSAAQ